MTTIQALLTSAEPSVLLPHLEVAEQDAASCQKPHPFAAAHLLCLLITDNLCEARFLWRRLPLAAREDPAVAAAWAAARALWQGKRAPFYQAASIGAWPSELRPLVERMLTRVREQAVNSVRTGYDVLSVERFAGMVGLAEHEVGAVCARLGWVVEGGFVIVHRKEEPRADTGRGLELQRLTEQLVRLQTNL